MDDDKTLQTEVEETLPEEKVDGSTTETEVAKEPQKPEEKLIPQSELDRIIGERLARERKKLDEEKANDPHRKFIERQAKRHNMTPEEYLAEVDRLQALADAEEEAKSKGIPAEALLRQKELERKLAEIERREAEQKQKAEEEAKQREVSERWAKEFAEKYPQTPIQTALQDSEFMEFAKDFAPNVSLARRYERYLREKQLSELAKQHGEELNSLRSTSSGRTQSDGQTYGLSAEQQELAKAAGLTMKQYHDLLPRRRK